LSNVEGFIPYSDFFTIDVADFIGKKAEVEEIKHAINQNRRLIGSIGIPGIAVPFTITEQELQKYIDKYLFAILEAGRIYRYIENKKGKGNFVTEVSIDEVDEPQSPVEFLIILALLANEKYRFKLLPPGLLVGSTKEWTMLETLQDLEKNLNNIF
jgi:hypothetical protein